MICVFTSVAQTKSTAIVYSLTGKGKVWRNGKKIALKYMQNIYEKDSIELISPSLIIVTKNKKYIEINKSGNYKFSNLLNTPNCKKLNVTDAFAEFMWHELFVSHQNNENYYGNSIGKATGAGIRGSSDCDSLLMPYNNSKFSQDSIIFSWKGEPKKDFKITIKGLDNELEIFEQKIVGNSIIVAKNELPSSKEGKYSWKITALNYCNESEYNFQFFGISESKTLINKLLSEIDKSKPKEIVFLEKINILIKNGWFDEAVKIFLQHKVKNK